MKSKNIRKKYFNNYKINPEYSKTFENIQLKILKSCVVISILTFIVELLFLFHYLAIDHVFQFGLKEYIIFYIIKPTLLNMLFCGSGIFAYKKLNITEEERLAIPCLVLLLCIMNIITSHSIYETLYPLVVIPIYISNIYGDINIEKRMTHITIGGSIVMFAIIATNPMITPPKDFMYNAILTLFIVIVSHYISLDIIIHEKEKTEILMEKIDTNKKLKEEIRYDGLTKLLNHKAFVSELNKCCDDNDTNLCLSIIDIDHFKEVNDTYGHAKGDNVLKELAKLLRELQDENIVAGRYGGEEFVVIIKNKTAEESFDIIDGIRKKFSKISFEDIDRCITFSAGITSFSDTENAIDFFKRTDSILYKAKRNGRNKCIYENTITKEPE